MTTASYLVTGGAGFIGSHIAEMLLREGAVVRVFDNLATGRQRNIEALKKLQGELEIINGDLRDSDAVGKAVTGVEVVFHVLKALLDEDPFATR